MSKDLVKYPIDHEAIEHLEKTFTHHPPFGDQLERYQHLREEGKALAFLIIGLTPRSQEQSVSLYHLEQAITSANAAIARHEKRPVEKPYKFAGCYGGHDPNELPLEESEHAGGDPLPLEPPCGGKTSASLPGLTGLSDFPNLKPTRERNVIPA